ncbi:MAG: hypothetical protein HY321_16815 [Armatimonadetes bacterium]|nr:hypothetical protein [Armatimonadota bacterium]
MHVAIVEHPLGLSAYCEEILGTWGLALHETVPPGALPTLDPAAVPVVIAPASVEQTGAVDPLIEYARRGGTLICFLPEGPLAAAAGLTVEGEHESPARLRITAMDAAGIAGELLPIVGRIGSYRAAEATAALAHLCCPGRSLGDSPGITEARVGRGRILAFAFDLPRCVLLLRQGDPARAESRPNGDACSRPSHLAADIGLGDSSWIPFADLLSRILMDQVRRHLKAPVPLWHHLPASAPAILLYAGDEDGADVAWNDEQFNYLASVGARMNLYMIPTNTKSTRADTERYLAHHDLGPHPNLRSLDRSPVSARLEELERQILMFEEMFGIKARTVRNHCTAWAGYLEPVEVMEKLDVRMDANYFSGTYMRDRQHAPYAAFGAAMPMRFCRPDGRVLNVFQQHTHVADDVLFGPGGAKSFKIAPRVWAVTLERIFTDMVGRFHTPLGLCIHPTNWVRFSRPHGQELLSQAEQQGIPAWSFDQWCAFREARDGWRFQEVTWAGNTLAFRAEGSEYHPDLRIQVPLAYGGLALREVLLDGKPTAWVTVTRFRERAALLSLPGGKSEYRVQAAYGG